MLLPVYELFVFANVTFLCEREIQLHFELPNTKQWESYFDSN